METIYLAGGCFWGVEELIRKLPGIVLTDVGYSGGHLENATYKEVSTGTTGHAEAMKINFNPSEISLAKILDFFFRIHNPTTPNQQGNDIGSQYRSVIFYSTEKQKEEAEQAIQRAQNSGMWDKPIVTEVVPFKYFIRGEEYHQDYLQKNPNGYTCHWIRS